MSTPIQPVANLAQSAVAYYWEQDDLHFLPEQRKAVEKYAQDKSVQVAAEYTDKLDKKRKGFPELEAAIKYCQQHNLRLLIARLHNLTTSEDFTDLLIKNKVNFLCLDRPTINPYTLQAVVEDINQRRKEHSDRIKHGLESSTAHLGNPNALKEIIRVNKPKTENAVMFALLLLPIIANYRRQGFSQRKMVDTLNAEGFPAPEGGKWVLSQLQKVLDRIDLNVIALNSISTIQDCKAKGLDEEHTIKTLNALSVRAPQRGGWTREGLADVRERLELIEEIGVFNDFVLNIYPHIVNWVKEGLTDADIAKSLNEQNISVPERILWEIAQEQPEGAKIESADTGWQAERVKVARSLSARRAQDIRHFVNPHTYEVAQGMIK